VAYDRVELKHFLNAISQNSSFIPAQADITTHQLRPWETINSRFLLYPFNFDEEGSLRTHVGIPKADYELWKAFVARSEPRKMRSHATSESQPRAPVPDASDASDAPDDEPANPVAPLSIYDQTLTTLATLKEQLRTAKEGHRQEKQRADKLEQQNTNLTISQETREQALAQARVAYINRRTQLRNENAALRQTGLNDKEQATTAKQRITALETEVKKLRDEAAEAARVATEKDAQMKNVLGEAQKLVGLGKRKATGEGEGSGGQEKRARV
jgi:hypothetical protein